MSEKSILVVGAGIAGLSAGCYAQMNGYSSQIFELHTIPGGLCTSWKRKGFTFDGGLWILNGASPKSSTYPLWDEIGVIKDQPIYYYPELTRYEGNDGRTFILHTNIDLLEKHMLDLSPQDEGHIREFTNGCRQFTKMDLPVDLTPSEPLEALELGKNMLPVMFPLLRWMNVSIRQFASHFKDPLLREALPEFFQFSPPDFPMMLALSTIAMLNDEETGYPLGGSLKFALRLARRYQALGGEIHYQARINKILVEDHKSVGVVLEDGTVYRGDIVISGADGRSTIFNLLGGEYLNEKIQSYYKGLTVTKSLLQIAFGVAEDFSNQPASINFPLSKPIWLGNIRHDRLLLKNYCFDPMMAPSGKSVLSLWCEADYDYWKHLHNKPEKYEAAKRDAAEEVLDVLDVRYPGLRSKVEVIDVATPITYERYTANWRGAFAGWALTTRKMSMMMGNAMSKTLPGLENFYMIGQWVEPGGNVELSAASGRDVIKDICQSAEKPFTARVPDL
jgi:phytoene dehydrogenase-like protein